MSFQPDIPLDLPNGTVAVPAFDSETFQQELLHDIRELGTSIQSMQSQYDSLASRAGLTSSHETATHVLNGYLWVFVIAFIVTLIATPVMRRLALRHGIIDKPSDPRKVHRIPVAYLGGAAVFLGLMGGVLFSYLAIEFPGLIRYHNSKFLDGIPAEPIPWAVVFGMFVIMLVGLLDDVMDISPRIKIAGQLFAAAALAYDNVGVAVASGLVRPLGQWLFNDSELIFNFGIPGLEFDTVYWVGTALIALFVLGGCNAANLVDGLDGLLGGITIVAMLGLLGVATVLALRDDGERDAQRIILCMSVLGACLGFLPYNFNPASIFLGDCGSMLLGYCTVVIILTLGDSGDVISRDYSRTHLVFAGLLIWAIPIVDTVLAIIRRKMAGLPLSAPDDQHLHHMLKRALGVKGAVFSLYGIGLIFASIGVLISLGNARLVYAVGLVFAAFLVVTAIKVARLKQIVDEATAAANGQHPFQLRSTATIDTLPVETQQPDGRNIQ
ncbi:MAG: undecaprenyl/decaprenyl-phosphate alpha-N-acetylglucosaminyl 1-phosphate transferase [Phycisphaeraceae bacterium]|nr:undecaprenyl/decaprenyl-phosphate alpha-N-acetylglucosaminyl 1-phosphate transferase [Phycisphaerales bacterium]MCB9861095.1 undecaprenyl/decaprenyl-phosphate alpha-N-acetylglucosaminyl 1-phosphate transferase [Phycisphaeraceae bacterium]